MVLFYGDVNLDNLRSKLEHVFDLVIKVHDFHVRDYGFKIHKIEKFSVMYTRV